MPMFRKKPVVIEARKFPPVVSIRDQLELAAWCKGSVAGREAEKILIPTLEGVMTAARGDWIIKGVKGEFYPVKPDIFEATYEAVD